MKIVGEYSEIETLAIMGIVDDAAPTGHELEFSHVDGVDQVRCLLCGELLTLAQFGFDTWEDMATYEPEFSLFSPECP